MSKFFTGLFYFATPCIYTMSKKLATLQSSMSSTVASLLQCNLMYVIMILMATYA